MSEVDADFSGKVVAVIPPTRRLLSWDRRTTYILDEFKITAMSSNWRIAAYPVEKFVRKIPAYLNRILTFGYG